MILALLATLGAIVVAFVLFPVFSSGDVAPFDLGAVERERVDLTDTKNRLLESIKDLDFEKAAGKVSEEDYQTARDDYMTQVASILARLDELSGPDEAPAPTGDSRSKPSETETLACPSCSEPNAISARFCLECGAALEGAKRACGSCGEHLLPGAKFCTECGAKATD